MLSVKPFRVALVLSIGVHAALFSPLSGLVNRPLKAPDTNIVITYVEIAEEAIIDTLPMPLLVEKVPLKKELPAPKKAEEETGDEETKSKMLPEKKIAKKAPDKNKVSRKKENKSAFSPEGVLNLNSLSYHTGTSDSLDYLKTIRDKISAYVHKKYRSFIGEGDVLLHFTLNNDGSVYTVTVLSANLGKNRGLKKLCVDSVYNSSPFKPFPEEISLNRASFRINISFKRD